METNEMKQKNEEILARWRSLGFLSGLKEGSINEWRCAKSFENAAIYLMEKEINSPTLETFAFPFIRRVLCTGKKRLHRILTAEEVCDFLSAVTVDECMEQTKKRVKTKIGLTMVKLIENFLAYTGAGKETFVGFCDSIKLKDTENHKMFSAIMDGVFDFEAELLSAATDIFVETKNN